VKTVLHRGRPRLRQGFDPMVQPKTRGRDRTFAVNRTTAILHAETDRPVLNIQPDVIVPAGSLLGVSASASAKFSFCTPSAPPPTYAFKFTRAERLVSGVDFRQAFHGT
jgi:hypothetical protein